MCNKSEEAFKLFNENRLRLHHNWRGFSRSGSCARLTEESRTRVLLLEAGRDFTSAETPEHIRIPNPLHAIADDDYRWPTLLAREPKFNSQNYFGGGGLSVDHLL